jgi:ribonuclease D
VELAIKRPDNLEEVAKVIGWRTRLEAPPFGRWLKVLTTSLKTPITEQVELRVASQSMPPIKIWKEKNPLGYARLTHARAALIELSKQLQIPTENLVTPDYVKRICWQDPPTNVSEYESFVEGELTRLGARSWQVEQVVSVIAPHLSATEALVVPESAEVENEASVAP